MHEPAEDGDNGCINTHEYEYTVHIVLEGMNPGFIVALCLTQVQRPHGISIVIEIANHTRHFRGHWLSGVATRSFRVTRLIVFACIFSNVLDSEYIGATRERPR